MVTFMIMESTSGKHSPTPGTHESMSSRLGDGEQGCHCRRSRPGLGSSKSFSCSGQGLFASG